MRYFFRDIWVVGRYELAESIRSRRALVVLVLFLAGGVLTCNGIVSGIHKAEKEISKTLGLPQTTSAGVLTDELWKHKGFRRIMASLIGDKAVAEELLSVPPMAMIFSWLSFTFAPLLVMLTSSTRISEELGSGSIRFAAIRSSRAAWCLGKYIGQACVLIVVLMLSAVAAWCVFRFRLAGIDSIAMARALIIYAWKVWLYSLSFVGLALGVSQMTHSPNKAMSIGFMMWFVMGILAAVASVRLSQGGTEYWQLLQMVIPMGHQMDMWRMSLAHQVQAAFFLITLGLTYMFAGYFWFGRKDI